MNAPTRAFFWGWNLKRNKIKTDDSWSVETAPFGISIGDGTMNKGSAMVDQGQITTMYKLDGTDTTVLNRQIARRCDDLALELHGLGNELHKAGLHRQGTAADVAAGIVETIQEELSNEG